MRIISCILIICIFGCIVTGDPGVVVEKLIIKDSNRELINSLDNPLLSYVLKKDGAVVEEKIDIPLILTGDYYSIELSLMTGANYEFSSFTIKCNGVITFILDTESTNPSSFSVDINGLFSKEPTVYLKKVDNPVFDSIEYSGITKIISIDQTSTIGRVPLTFKVSSNIDNAEFKIYMYSVYWRLGATLPQNGIFDMDTGKAFNPLSQGEGDPWGTGSFKIETTDSNGDIVSITGTADLWNEKHIVLNL